MTYPYLVSLWSLLMMSLPVVGYAQGSDSSNAIPIILPMFQDAWIFEAKMGARHIVPLTRTREAVWYKFDLEDDLVIYAQHFGTEENNASVELLDKSLKTIAKSSNEGRMGRLIYNDELKQGTYFLKVTSITSNGKPFKIELCKFSKRQTEEGRGRTSKPRSARVPARDFSASELVGEWRCVDDLHKLATSLAFKQDGTYSGSVAVNGKTNGSFSGKWGLKEWYLHYEYTASSDKNVPAGTIDQDRVLEITKDNYTIENALGVLETYARIR